MNDFLNQFQFPPEAQDFINSGLVQRQINSGNGGSVSTFQSAGHDRGISFRFFLHPVKNEVKSEEFDMEINDEIEMIEWNVSKDFKPVERVHMIPEYFLKFRKVKGLPDCNGKPRMVFKRPFECTGGVWKEAYIAWKEGRESLGLPLERWEKLSIAQVATLQALGVFSVQQFASMPRDRVEGRMPPDLVEAFESAIQFVNSQKPMQDVQKYADQVLQLKQEAAARDRELETLKEQMAGLLANNSTPKKKLGRKPKAQTEEIAA